MGDEAKVLWTEGMFLRPHHFQQLERHLQAWIDDRLTPLTRYPWGLVDFELNEPLLLQGKVGLRRCRGVFADGTPFAAPERDSLPPPLEVPKGTENCLVVLALPLKRPDGKLLSSEENGTARYCAAEITARDVETEGLEQEAVLTVGRLNLKLALADQLDLGAHTYLPLLQIAVRKEGEVFLERTFIPTVARVGASPVLQALVEELGGLLHNRSDELAHRLAAPSAGGVAEVVDFLFLQILNRYRPLFDHLSRTGTLHPEGLYRLLIQLIGELATITREERLPPEFPPYDHLELTPIFQKLADLAREALNWVPSGRAVPIPLKPVKANVYLATVSDRPLLTGALFVLAANAEMAADKLRQLLPRQTTVAAPAKLKDLVMTHTPGVKLIPLPVAPRQIPFHAGFNYFELDRSSPLWKELAEVGAIALHIAGTFPGLELELWAIPS